MFGRDVDVSWHWQVDGEKRDSARATHMLMQIAVTEIEQCNLE